MASLLERLKGTENSPENGPEIPDGVPPEWVEGSAGIVASEEFEQDPPPGKSRARRPVLKVATSGNVTPALRRRISAELEAYIEFATIPLVLRDEVCGEALHQQAKPIADAITAILSRYPDLAHKFLATGVFGDWLKLGVALQPFAKTVWDHHVTAKPETEEAAPNVDYTGYLRPGS